MRAHLTAATASIALTVAAWVLLGLMAHTLQAPPSSARPAQPPAAQVMYMDREGDGDRY